MITPHGTRPGWPLIVVAAIVALGLISPIVLGAGGARDVVLEPTLSTDVWQEDLVSDLPGLGMFVDEWIVNPMGIEMAPLGLLVVANNGTGVLTVHQPSGLPLLSPNLPLVVTVPAAPSSPVLGSPTGIARNHMPGFDVASGDKVGRSLMLVATEDGLILGWNPYVEKKRAIMMVDRSASGSSYFGLDVGMGATGPVLAAADFGNGKVDLFNDRFELIDCFTDPDLPEGFAPFNVRSFNGRFYVAFALRAATPAGEVVKGHGLGFIDVFGPDGAFIQRLATGDPLNAPWALVKAPPEMHDLAGMLLVGNVGDGRINAFDMETGYFYRTLRNDEGKPVRIPDLFGLVFHKDFVHGGDTSLYFTAAIDDGLHGLFGRLEPLKHR